MIYELGPRSRRVYGILRDDLLGGHYTAGTKLPSHTQLAAEFGVATLTIRHVLARLEDDGLVVREHGRGTFVCPHVSPSVLAVDDDELARRVLSASIERAGSDVHMPELQDGIDFIRAVAHRWPDLPLAAVTAYPADLLDLRGRPECPFLVLSKPVQPRQIEMLLRVVLKSGESSLRRGDPTTADRRLPTKGAV
jgi:DNA-binding transcriptional regulator YhcF (GntR family)